MADVKDLVFIVANKRSFTGNDATASVAGRTALFPDCTVSISHKWDNDVTEHPIERGAAVSDHVSQKNAVFEISGIFNQYSLQKYNGNVVETGQKIQDAYDYLLTLRNTGVPFTLVSKYSTYNDCVVKSLEIPVAPTDGNNTLIFSMTAHQIRQVSSEQVRIAQIENVSIPYQDTASSKTSEGSKQKQPERIEVVQGDWVFNVPIGRGG